MKKERKAPLARRFIDTDGNESRPAVEGDPVLPEDWSIYRCACGKYPEYREEWGGWRCGTSECPGDAVRRSQIPPPIALARPTVVSLAREAFAAYAALPAGEWPADPWSRLQLELARWQVRNFGSQPDASFALGMGEEIGELADAVSATLGMAGCTGAVIHAALKSAQRIRGMDDGEKCRAAIGDAVADNAIFAMQLCTSLRLDYGTLVRETAVEVLRREWKK